MSTKNIHNFNAMRGAIIKAHNMNNKKAISKDLVAGLNIDNGYFELWIANVAKLRAVCFAYVQVKHSISATREEKTKARSAIFPVWKKVLQHGEKNCDTTELRVSAFDVDSLVGYAETFVASAKGTQIAGTTEQIFRKYVEALLGTRIAGNEVLSDTDRDALQDFYSLKNSIETGEKKIKELKEQVKGLNLIIAQTQSEDFKKYIGEQVKVIKADITNTENRIRENKEALIKAAPAAEQVENTLHGIE